MSDDNEAMTKLKDVSSGLLKALGDKAMSTVSEKVEGLTDHLDSIADGGPIGQAVSKGAEESAGGGNAAVGAVKGAFSGIKDKVTGGSSGGSGDATSSTNIIEQIDVGVPISVAYNQWTEYGEFPSFMKKVEQAETEEDNKVEFKAQIFLSHRTWEATILEQIPDERIVWRSTGEKGHVDGAVTFHELGPNLTRILLVLEYYPQGFFEKTGNLWRAQGRRAKAELKHFRRHVMTRTILEPDEVEGWRGVIEDEEVVKSHEEVVEEEESEEEPEQDDEPEDDYDDEGESEEYDEPGDEDVEDEPEDEAVDEEEPEEDLEEPEDEVDEEEPEEEYDEPEDEVEDEDEEEVDEEEPEDEYDEESEDEVEDDLEEPEDEEEDEAPEPRRRRRAS
ncbi:SRPBCC family protein [Nocardioides sp.]|uniref:SRPBCC family protein n=1 Tax=Nocardioides sp. TaxID=35761 RepID=UPI002733940F|nr:SRPBCC family protein [Nocardioides sp.]MDP3893122.1 SRPBCC family protein [Nocardioides sp.]